MQELGYKQEVVKSNGSFRKRCPHCNKKFVTGDCVEWIYNSGGYHPFCLGHMEVWAKEKRLGYLLEKL